MITNEQGPVDGLKLLLRGDELRQLLKERVDVHRQRAAHWQHEQARSKEDDTKDRRLLPDHICEHEAERHEWRADVLAFIREHIDANRSYWLGEPDVEFGELLPEKPGSITQEEYEERTRVGFTLERLAKSVRELAVGLGFSHSRQEVLADLLRRITKRNRPGDSALRSTPDDEAPRTARSRKRSPAGRSRAGRNERRERRSG